MALVLLLGWRWGGPGVVAFRRAEGRIGVPLGFFIGAILRAYGSVLAVSGGKRRSCEFPLSCPLRPLASVDGVFSFFVFFLTQAG